MNNPSDPSEEVRRLICEQVPEIGQGKVQIKGIARDQGYRTILAVCSTDAQIDAVGAVVGERGVRLKALIRRLAGEKIEVVRWEETIKEYLSNLIGSARFNRVVVDPESNRVTVFVPSDQISLIGGPHSRRLQLVARLTGRQLIVMGEHR